MAFNVNALMLPAVSAIREALRAPLECLLCLDAFHAAGEIDVCSSAISHLYFVLTGISGKIIID